MQDFINDICDFLNISVPKISYDTSNFQTDTMLAQYNSKLNTVYIKKYDKPTFELFFSIAHELRHAWQIKNYENFYFSNYKTVDQCNSIEEYNLQIAEIDANAFSYIAMSDCFGLKPLFNNVSDSIKSKILERVEYLDSIL